MGAESEPSDASIAGEDLGVLDAGYDDCVIVDTTGWSVRTPFDGEHCLLPGRDVPAESHPVDCPDGHEPFAGWSIDGRVIDLAATCVDEVGWSGHTGFWRPIACERDADCQRIRQAEFPATCRAGICQSLGAPLRQVDIMVLCLADAWRERRTWTVPGSDPALSRARELAELYCPAPPEDCEVPPECRPL